MIELHTVNQSDSPDERYCSGCGVVLDQPGQEYAALGHVAGNGLHRVCRACIMRLAAAFLIAPDPDVSRVEIYDLREG